MTWRGLVGGLAFLGVLALTWYLHAKVEGLKLVCIAHMVQRVCSSALPMVCIYQCVCQSYRIEIYSHAGLL